MDQGLEAYITQCQTLGISHADILAALKTAGWSGFFATNKPL